jgi:hypothetical protein
MGRRLRALVLLGAAIALASCGGGSGGATSSEKPGPAPAALCARIPLPAVERLVDRADPRKAPPLQRSAAGTERLLQCHFTAKGVKVGVSLDRAQNNRQRFDNRITEMSQFSTNQPATLPRPVRGVGDPRTGNFGAEWIPALEQMLAYRPGAYLIVDFSAGEASDTANRNGAADLGRLSFAVLPRAHGTNKRVQRPTG